jgi:hypothetical protein
MNRHFRRIFGVAAVLIVLALADPSARADMITHTGLDIGVGPGDAHPQADAASRSFQAAAGSLSLVNFQGLPLGYPTTTGNGSSTFTLGLGHGVTAKLSSVDPNPPTSAFEFGVCDDHQNATLGYHVVPTVFQGTSGLSAASGTQFLRFVPHLKSSPASLVFSFSVPVTAFGFDITGLGGDVDGRYHVNFESGNVHHDVPLSGDPKGGLLFFGATGLEGPTSQVRLVSENVGIDHRDVIGIDNLVFSSLSVPEPGPIMLFGLWGAVLVAVLGVRRLLAS